MSVSDTYQNVTMRGGVQIVKLSCNNGHTYSWTSSPYLPNGKFVANTRFIHSYHTTGLLPSQFERFSSCMGFTSFDATVKLIESDYRKSVDEEAKVSCEVAIIEEINSAFEREGVIDIMTDARHGHRKNAKDTNVVCIGQSTHKVLKDIHVTKDEDPCTQRHELLGTKKVYEYFDSNLPFISGPVNVHAHAHDRNSSVNKFIRDERIEVINQNDTWHAGKSVEKAINKIARGPKKLHGKTWHEEITDQVLSVRTHVQYAIRRCGGSGEKLRSMMDNVTEHYQNKHEHCSEESRCRTEPNYEPSKHKLYSQVAIDLLQQAIRDTVVYKHPEDFVLAMDTYYVEGFNNVLNIFHDKRIYFSDRNSYKMRTDLAICHWNDNVNRPYTSVWTGPNGHMVRKNFTKAKLDYRERIWAKLMDKVYA